MKNTLFALFCAILALAVPLHAQTNVTLDGTSGTNSITNSYSTTGGLNLSLGFFADYLVVAGGGGGGGSGTDSSAWGSGGGGGGRASTAGGAGTTNGSIVQGYAGGLARDSDPVVARRVVVVAGPVLWAEMPTKAVLPSLVMAGQV